MLFAREVYLKKNLKGRVPVEKKGFVSVTPNGRSHMIARVIKKFRELDAPKNVHVLVHLGPDRVWGTSARPMFSVTI